MVTALLYPYWIFVFLCKDVPIAYLRFCLSFNEYYLQLFSFRLLFKTFFRPLKNEYRQGLVGISIVLGMLVKACLLSFTIVSLFVFMLVELAIFFIVIFLPFYILVFVFRK